jgi:hypothetical protein
VGAERLERLVDRIPRERVVRVRDGDREVDRQIRPGAAVRGRAAARDVDPGLSEAERGQALATVDSHLAAMMKGLERGAADVGRDHDIGEREERVPAGESRTDIRRSQRGRVAICDRMDVQPEDTPLGVGIQIQIPKLLLFPRILSVWPWG